MNSFLKILVCACLINSTFAFDSKEFATHLIFDNSVFINPQTGVIDPNIKRTQNVAGLFEYQLGQVIDVSQYLLGNEKAELFGRETTLIPFLPENSLIPFDFYAMNVNPETSEVAGVYAEIGQFDEVFNKRAKKFESSHEFNKTLANYGREFHKVTNTMKSRYHFQLRREDGCFSLKKRCEKLSLGSIENSYRLQTYKRKVMMTDGRKLFSLEMIGTIQVEFQNMSGNDLNADFDLLYSAFRKGQLKEIGRNHFLELSMSLINSKLTSNTKKALKRSSQYKRK